jgi:predicted phosphoribosyltransferase
MFVEIILAVLLIVTISYTFVLNRKLGNLRRDKAQLESLAASFSQATLRAEESIGRLKNTAEGIHDKIEKAQALRDDLAFLVDRGTSAADRLEAAIRSARAKAPAPVPNAAGDGAVQPRSEAERELLRAIRSAG